MGFEPTTTGITIRDSNQLSYAHHKKPCLSEYTGRPAIHITLARPTGIEPVTASLEGWCSIRLSYGRLFIQFRPWTLVQIRTLDTRHTRSAHGLQLVRPPEQSEMVGVEGFEPPTPCSQSRCATRLRYTPRLRKYS